MLSNFSAGSISSSATADRGIVTQLTLQIYSHPTLAVFVTPYGAHHHRPDRCGGRGGKSLFSGSSSRSHKLRLSRHSYAMVRNSGRWPLVTRIPRNRRGIVILSSNRAAEAVHRCNIFKCPFMRRYAIIVVSIPVVYSHCCYHINVVSYTCRKTDLDRMLLLNILSQLCTMLLANIILEPLLTHSCCCCCATRLSKPCLPFPIHDIEAVSWKPPTMAIMMPLFVVTK